VDINWESLESGEHYKHASVHTSLFSQSRLHESKFSLRPQPEQRIVYANIRNGPKFSKERHFEESFSSGPVGFHFLFASLRWLFARSTRNHHPWRQSPGDRSTQNHPGWAFEQELDSDSPLSEA
jgi:hypothetical protein